jgi:hypothetical protein
MDRDPSRGFGAEQEMKREQLKSELEKLIGELPEGYVREGETVTVNVPETPTVRKLKAQGEWAEGDWKNVARVDARQLANPPAELKRTDKTDHLYQKLVEAGYRVSAVVDFEQGTDEHDFMEYYLYKQE